MSNRVHWQLQLHKKIGCVDVCLHSQFLSQEKAVQLKDAYVKGIMDGAVGSETSDAFSAMPEQDMGDEASVLIDMDNSTMTMTNDGDPNNYVRQNGRYMTGRGFPPSPFPLVIGGPGASNTQRAWPSALMETQQNIDNGFYR